MAMSGMGRDFTQRRGGRSNGSAARRQSRTNWLRWAASAITLSQVRPETRVCSGTRIRASWSTRAASRRPIEARGRLYALQPEYSQDLKAAHEAEMTRFERLTRQPRLPVSGLSAIVERGASPLWPHVAK